MQPIRVVLCLSGALLLSHALTARAALVAGDVVITGYQDNGSPDTFTFYNLVPLPAGTVLYFTDNGWTGSGFRGVSSSVPAGLEDVLQFTVHATLPAGTYINTADTAAGFSFDRTATFKDLSFATTGDQINIFTSTFPTNPALAGMTHLFALTTNASFQNATSNTTGGIPPGLTQGLTAVATNKRAGTFQYNGPAGLMPPHLTRQQLLESLANPAHWGTADTLNNLLTPEPGGAMLLGLGILALRRRPRR